MKAAPKTAEYWRSHVESYRASGLTRVEYCAQNGMRVATLDYWRKKFKCTEKNVVQNNRGLWLPVRVTDEPVPDRDAQIDLRIGRIIVEVKQGFDPKLLSEVLRAVGAAC